MAVRAQRFLSSRARWIVFGLLVAVGVYLLAVTPIRTYVEQRQQMHQAEQRYELLAKTNRQLNERVQQLQSDAEIERLARERYELVPPGQQAYAVMPAPSPAPTVEVSPKHEGFWAKAWDTLSFWN